MVDEGERQDRRRLWLALALSASTQLIMAFTSTATNIAFPSIDESFDTPRTTLAWAITGFAIVQASLMLVSGRVADRVGRKRTFARGLWIFTFASIACALAPTGEIFVATRLAQGAGAAIVVPTALALVLHEVPDHRRIWVATTSMAIFSVGQSASPLVAALLTQALSWRLVYLVPAVMAAAVGIVGNRVFQEARSGADSGPIDAIGVVLGSLGIAFLAYSIGEGPHRGWTSAPIVVALVLSAVCLPLVVVRSFRHPDPLFEPRLFRLRSVWSASSTSVLLAAVGLGAWLSWPLLLSQGMGYSTLETGLLLTPVPILMALAAFVGGRLVDVIGARAVVLMGVGAWVVCLGLLVVSLGTDPDYGVDLLPGFLVGGVAFGFTAGPLQGLALRDVPHEVFGQVNALILTFRFVGSALGVALVIGMIGDAVPPPISGFRLAQGVLLVTAVLGGFLACFLPAHVSAPPVEGLTADEAEDELVAEIEAHSAP